MIIDDRIQGVINYLLANWSETERTVEIPFLFRELPNPKPLFKTRILDIGTCESPLIAKLDELGFDAWGIDMRDYGTPWAKFRRCDARNMKIIPSNSFDVVVAISTLEHIGLVDTPYNTDRSIDKGLDIDGDLKAIKEMVRVVKTVKDGGFIIMTLPYGDGSEGLKKWIRFYNKDRLDRIRKETDLVIFKTEYYIFKDGHWSRSDEETCSKMRSEYRLEKNLSTICGNICIVGYKDEK